MLDYMVLADIFLKPLPCVNDLRDRWGVRRLDAAFRELFDRVDNIDADEPYEPLRREFIGRISGTTDLGPIYLHNFFLYLRSMRRHFSDGVIPDRFTPGGKAEMLIATCSRSSILYAQVVLKGPFPAAEELISKSSHRSLEYAQFVLKGPFPLGEEAMSKDLFSAIAYAVEVTHDRFMAAEPVIFGALDYPFGLNAMVSLQLSEHDNPHKPPFVYIDFLRSIGVGEPELRSLAVKYAGNLGSLKFSIGLGGAELYNIIGSYFGDPQFED